MRLLIEMRMRAELEVRILEMKLKWARIDAERRRRLGL